MWFRGFLGNNSANPNILVDASAWQDVAGTPGQAYQLTFCEKHEFYFKAAEAKVALRFYSGGGSGTLLGASEFDLLATPGTNTNSAFTEPWFARSLSAIAPAGTDTVRVIAFMNDGEDNKDPAAFKPQGMMLDRFVLTAVPEPATAALAASLVVCGLAFKRRRVTS